MRTPEPHNVRGTILIVDDDGAVRDVTAVILRQGLPGCHIETAASGEVAFEVLKRLGIDVVITDIEMPGMSGLHLAAVVRRDFADIPVILFTGYTEHLASQEALDLDCFAYLSKPIATEDLITTVRRALNRRSGENRGITAPRTELTPATSSLRADLEEFGKMIAGTTHDLRNGLGLIRTYSELALQTPEGPEDREAIRKISQALQYSELILGNLSDLVARARPLRHEHDLNRLIRDTLSVLEPRIPATVEVKVDLVSGSVIVLGDEGQLKRVLMNLIQNATHAMPDGGTLSIETRRPNSEDARVELHVRDTGIGIPAAQIKRIFELSYSTKREGYGLGLFIVRRLVDAHNGTIEVRSEQGQGTNFRIELPTVDRANQE